MNDTDKTKEQLIQELIGLREDSMVLRMALRISDTVVFEQDQELRYTKIYNPHPAFTNEDVLGKADEDLVPPDDALLLTKIKRNVLETGVSTRENVRTSIGDEVTYYDLIVDPITDESGEITGILCSSMNITERKQIEDALHESEKLYRNLFETIMHEVHLWKLVRDEQGAIKTWQLVEANPAALKAWGKNRPDIIGKTTDEIFLYNATEQFMPIVKKIFSEGTPYTWEAYFPPTDEFLYMTSVPFGEYFISTGTDVTELRRAELKANHERNLLRTIIDNIPDYIFVKDTDGRFIETNVAHANAANLTREEMLNRHANDIYEPDFAQQFHADDALVLKTGQPIINEERLTIGSNKTEKWVLTTKVPLRDPESKIIGLIGISRDITDRRQAEQQRLKAEQLRIEIESERKLIELKQRFINTASHNLRTPLSIISSSTSILQRYSQQLSPEDKQAKYAKIQSQVDHMKRLLDDVLRIGKLNAGKLELEYTTFYLKPCCEHIWNDFLLLDGNNHTTEFLFDATIETITADEQLLQYAVMNLLSNAFKYTPDSRKILFHVSNDEQGVKIRIQDEGIGIPEADIKHLFQPFTRASNVETIKGTGLGLVITKEYIELHGGTIAIESKENKGTTFTIHLPMESSNSSLGNSS